MAAAADIDPYSEVKIESKSSYTEFKDLLTIILRPPYATDICRRPTQSSYLIKTLPFKNSHRPHSTRWRNGATGEGVTVENKASLDKTEW
jgi:hypothetical protein